MGVLFAMLHDGTFYEPRTTETAAADPSALMKDIEAPPGGAAAGLTGKAHDAVTPASSDPQDVADAVARSIQSRMILMAGCFSAAFARLAIHHDRCDTDMSSAEVLRRMVIEWELEDNETT
jgi:hypothetical protein